MLPPAYKPKTLQKVKEDMLSCSLLQSHPMEMTREEDVHCACDLLKSLDSDHWANVWMQIARPYEEKAKEQEKAGNYEAAKNSYLLAYNYYRMARFTVPDTEFKKEAYRSSVANYLEAARYFDPPLEKVLIPFKGNKNEGKEIAVYLRRPDGIHKPPVLIHHAGIDVFKEEQILMDRAFLERGIATLAIDMPGTGESPISGSTDGERLYSVIITYIQNQISLDGSRIGLMGMSTGGYWAAKIAHIEIKRLKAVVFWGGGVHYYWQPDWQIQSCYSPTHLGNIDLIDTRRHAFDIDDRDKWLEYAPSLSLLDMGILDNPCAPMLLVNGKDDSQVPIEDLYLLLEHGAPKTARVFPGGHMGMTPQTLPTIADWMNEKLCNL